MKGSRSDFPEKIEKDPVLWIFIFYLCFSYLQILCYKIVRTILFLPYSKFYPIENDWRSVINHISTISK